MYVWFELDGAPPHTIISTMNVVSQNVPQPPNITFYGCELDR